jgi:probable F420-dependent oxidoreductase
MQFGLSLPNNYGVDDIQGLLALAPAAERLGYESVWVSEHLFHTAYVLQRLGSKPYYEPLTVLSAVAAMTATIRLGASVPVLPYHNPIRLAKTVATLDAISTGRVILGVGVGVIEEEFTAPGSPYKERGAYSDESLAIMQALWTQEDPQFAGTYYAFNGMKFSPKPVQQPHPPIWIGGSSRAAIRRAARLGDGWHPMRQSPDAVRRAAGELRQQASDPGRDASRIVVSVRGELDFAKTAGASAAEPWAFYGTATEIIDSIQAYQQAGASHVVLSMHTDEVNKIQDMMERFGAAGHAGIYHLKVPCGTDRQHPFTRHRPAVRPGDGRRVDQWAIRP